MELAVAIEVQESVRWEDWAALAAACEAHGIPTLYSSDHYLSTAGVPQRGALDAWGIVCALAATTSTLRLGTLVSPTSFRHPSVLAKLALTADHVSGGRVDLGMGAGWHEPEHRAFGLPFGDVGARLDVFEEQVEVVSGLLGPAPFSHSGKHYLYAGVDPQPMPVNGHVPLIVGGSGGPRSARIAARWADEYNTGGVDPAECRHRRERLDEACRRVGRDPQSLGMSVRMWLLAGRDETELWERARAVAALRGSPDRDPRDLLGELEAAGWIVGTPEVVGERLRALTAAGADRIVLALPLHRDLDQLALVADELTPRVAA
jgi:alkanesulfonate monooxygenase SsuD/methylene tetrahydromethanopterin reductase-like flavin-dependent oxidoreductase (luciferase family)